MENKKDSKKKKFKKPKSYKIESRFDKKTDKKKREINIIMNEFLKKAGYEKTAQELHAHVLTADLIIIAVGILFLLGYTIVKQNPLYTFIILVIISCTVLFGVVYLASLLLTLGFLDIRIYQRTAQIEEVLPDFLQLTSANISAGMTIDRALWLAVRPRFGVLAKEMEEIAKATTAGEDLETALKDFSKRYDSRVLKESMNLLIAGMNAGGEIGLLLNKISSNIQEIKLMRKEISASVTTYVIFIGAASIVAAPVLYALSVQLLGVVQSIAGSIGTDVASGGASTGFSFSFSADGLSIEDFRIFSMSVLGITAIMSASIISVIKRGNVKAGLKNVPIFLVIALAIYLVSGLILGSLFSSFF